VFYHGYRGLLRYMGEHGFTVDVVSADDDRARAAACREGVTLIPLNVTPSPVLVRDIDVLASLGRIFRAGGYDVVCVCTKKAAFFSAVLSKLFRTKCVYIVRGLTRDGGGFCKMIAFGIIEHVIASLADCVLMLSHSNAELFRRRRICTGTKLRVVHRGSLNGIDILDFSRSPAAAAQASALRSALGIPPQAFVAGFVGRLVRGKGISDLALIWNALRAKHPDLHLMIVSPPEVDRDVAGAVEQLRRDDRVHFAGFQVDMRPAYQSFDCLILPSHGEGFGNVFIEAGAMNVPSVAYNVPGACDVIRDCETGFLIEPHSIDGMVQGIEQLMNDRQRCRAMGANAREFVVANFARDVVIEGVTSLVRELCQSRRQEVAA
jgi:glycosyltransferase involved in cell wall biosynthesis